MPHIYVDEIFHGNDLTENGGTNSGTSAEKSCICEGRFSEVFEPGGLVLDAFAERNYTQQS